MITAVVTLGGGGAAVASSGKTHTPPAPKPYYLALGDSLSVGWQAPGQETSQGYANDLFKVYKKEIPKLLLQELGCPGETTGTMINGSCDGGTVYSDGNQLAQAEAFIATNKVAMITIDIGANDVDGCAGYIEAKNSVTGLPDPDALTDITNCVENGVVPTYMGADGYPASDYGITANVEGIVGIEADMPTILGGLQAALAASALNKNTPIYGMNFYDPFLALYLEGSPIAETSTSLADGLNSVLNGIYSTYNIPVANVGGMYNTDNATMGADMSYTPQTWAQGGIQTQADPVNVQTICALTWECTIYENIHANPLGYTVIAEAFEQVIGGYPV